MTEEQRAGRGSKGLTEAVPTLVVGVWRLRALRVEDAQDWLSIVRDPELRRLTSWNIDSLEEMRANVVSYLEGPKAHSSRRWAIVDSEDKLCGTCGFKDWNRESRSAELAYELAPEHRGRGSMTAVARTIVKQGLKDLDLEIIRALVMVENVASIRLLERLRFRRTATLSHFRRCGERMCDFYAYELRAPEASHLQG